MSKILTGSKAAVKLNGIKIAFASDFTVNHDNQLTDVDVLDQLEVAELAETGHKVNCTINLFKVDENTAASFGFDPEDINQLLSQGELTIEIYDRESDVVRYLIIGAKFAGGSGTMAARGVWTGTWNFRGKIGRGL